MEKTNLSKEQWGYLLNMDSTLFKDIKEMLKWWRFKEIFYNKLKK